MLFKSIIKTFILLVLDGLIFDWLNTDCNFFILYLLLELKIHIEIAKLIANYCLFLTNLIVLLLSNILSHKIAELSKRIHICFLLFWHIGCMEVWIKQPIFCKLCKGHIINSALKALLVLSQSHTIAVNVVDEFEIDVE